MNFDMKYFDKHSQLLEHYVEGSFGGLYLGFFKDWRDNLPPDSVSSCLKMVLKDTTDGKLYEHLMCSVFDKYPSHVLDNDYNSTEVWTLMFYFYGSHHCPCHRKTDARLAGAITDEECEGNRFLIERVTPLDSNLILISEVYSLEELEEMIKHE